MTAANPPINHATLQQILRRPRCEKCNSLHVHVTTTRGDVRGDSPVTRYYKCDQCGHNTKIIHV